MANASIRDCKNIRNSKQSLSEQVAEQIRELIIEQQWEIGAKIPGEFELAEQLNVGRSSVREAVKILVARNILEIRRGKGTYIAHNTGVVDDPFGLSYMDDEMRLAKELYQIRVRLEPWIAQLAAQNATDEDIAELKRWEAEIKELIPANKNYLPADQSFHVAIANCTHNRVLPTLIPTITFSVHLFGKMNYKKMGEETLVTHRNIVAAIERRDPQAAYDAMIEHLRLNIITVPGLADYTELK